MKQKIFEPGYKPFKEPVTIKCVVNGKKMLAEILGETKNPVQYGLMITFSNGVSFEAITSEDDGGWVVSEERYGPYLLAMQNELKSFLAVMHEDWYKFEITHGERNMLVWVAYREGDDYPYSIHFDGDYQFNLKEGKPNWESISVRMIDPAPIDREIVHKVVHECKKEFICNRKFK
ncbi:hypothetical protein FW778_16970 [Ginsengibacter hankyongi]|uniref:Uncharacterized protein n=1 Tax=Ginsengibacter hankyongi TaxID=2607284 RepID=A0A5J5IEB0_9BACT|nr:hypothetical protein [Ginsengibacter hankyongi]KAA9037123.1 hypothetical protein FW778_16970 [Ginsengibacter hankyongi]